MRRPAIVVYDVFDDARRSRLREALAPLADRFQQSGWLLDDVGDAAAVAGRLSAGLAPADRLRVYRPCPSCARRAIYLPGDRPFGLEPSAGWVAL